MTPLDISVSTRKVTHKALPVLDRKLAAAASASVSTHKRRPREGKGEKEERPVKRRKTEPVPARTETPSKSKKVDASAINVGDSPDGPAKRKRGRPRLSSPRLKGKDTLPVKTEDGGDMSPRPVHMQPRNTNGRFGKKDKALKREKAKERQREREREREKNGAATAPDTVSARDERAKAKAIRNGEDEGSLQATRTSPRSKKREHEDAGEEQDESPRKKISRAHEGEVQFLQKVLPRPASGFRGGRLVSNPNPLRFALHAWAGPVVLDESSSEDEKGPVTPEDEQSPPATDIATAEESTEISLFVPVPSIQRGALTVKPSPFTYAKRRWVSLSAPSTAVAALDADKLDNGVKKNVADVAASKKAPVSIDRPYQWAGANDTSLSDGEVCLLTSYPNLPHHLAGL